MRTCYRLAQVAIAHTDIEYRVATMRLIIPRAKFAQRNYASYDINTQYPRRVWQAGCLRALESVVL